MDTDNAQPVTVFNVGYSPGWFVSPEDESELHSSQVCANLSHSNGIHAHNSPQATVAPQGQKQTPARLEVDTDENSYVRNSIEYIVQVCTPLDTFPVTLMGSRVRHSTFCLPILSLMVLRGSWFMPSGACVKDFE